VGFVAYLALGAVVPNPLLILLAAVVAGLLAPGLFVSHEDGDHAA
jgi:hypothetical protein